MVGLWEELKVFKMYRFEIMDLWAWPLKVGGEMAEKGEPQFLIAVLG